MPRPCSPFRRGVVLQVVASRTKLRRGNALVTLFRPIRCLCLYPRFLAPNFLTITHNRYTRSQSSKRADRSYSTRARQQEINHLRGNLYVDTNKIFGHLSRAGLDVKVSRLMKGEDLATQGPTLIRGLLEARRPLQAYQLAQRLAIVAQDLELGDVLIDTLFLQSLAAYELRCYRKAGELLDGLRAVAKTANISFPKETSDRFRAASKAVDTRLRELQHGDYDWLSLFRNSTMTQGSEQRYLLEAADFIGPVKLDWAPGKGRGLFSTRDVCAGELLIVEKAICVGFEGENAMDHRKSYDFLFHRTVVPGISTASGRSVAQLISGVLDNPNLYHQLAQLSGGPRSDSLPSLKLPPSENVWLESELPAVDQLDLEQIKTMIGLNAYSLPLVEKDLSTSPSLDSKETGGLFYACSFMNHSCTPNAFRIAFGDIMVIRANTDIKKGSEITQSYMARTPYHLRASGLKGGWGIDCTCAMCQADRMEGHKVLFRRKQLIRYMGWMLGPIASYFGPLSLLLSRLLPSRWAHIPASPLIFTLKRLVRMMEDTFTHSEDRRYKDLHLSSAYSMLGALTKFRDHLTAIEYHKKALIANGTVLSSRNKKYKLRNRVPLPIVAISPMVSDFDISNMLQIAALYKVSNEPHLSSSWREAAVWAHDVCYGGGLPLLKERCDEIYRKLLWG